MKFEFKPSFDRSVKDLHVAEQEEIKQVAMAIIDVLSQGHAMHKGLGLKRLKGNFWEIRKGIRTRILFRWEGDLAEFVLAGNHDEIKRFLKSC